MAGRIHRRLGLYHVALRGCDGCIGSDETDRAAFITVLDSVLCRTGYRFHAYCMLPTQVHLAVQMSEIPLADFVQRLIMQFGRWMREHGRTHGLLKTLGEPRLVDGPEKCRELIRFIHLLPLNAAKDPVRYVWSGHRTYLGMARVACLDTRLGLRLFASDPREARARYEQYFAGGLQAASASRLCRSLIREARLAEQRVDSSVPQPGQTVTTIEQLAGRVAAQGSRALAEVLSGSRERAVSLLRALTAWHAVHLEMVSFREIARYLHRDPSSIYSAIKRYRTLHPQLFERPGHFSDLPAVAAAYGKTRNQRLPAAKVQSE